MSAEMKALVNSPVLWAITIGALVIVALYAVYFIKKSKDAAKVLGMSDETIKTAQKTAMISAIGPSVVIMVGMISLLVVAGAPTALMRLSVVGNIGYELQSAGIAAQVFGADGTAASMTPSIFQTCVFIMAVGCTGYLIVPAIFIDKMDATIQKMAGKDKKMTAIISTAAILGCYGYVDAPYILKMDNTTAALLVGLVVQIVCNKLASKTGKKWLLEWGLLFAMVSGMLVGVVVG